MSTNQYFNNFPKGTTSEQLLIESLIEEAIKIYGMDVYYMPRTTRSKVDYIYGEDQLKQYVSAYPIEMYLESITGMEGEGDFVSKFGLEIRDEVKFLVVRKRFLKEVPNLIRPREGDLLYIPLIQNFFEISFVEHENDQAMFYTLGKGRSGNVFVYAFKLKQFVFSNEIIRTGIDEIDLQIRESYPKTRLSINDQIGTFIKDEVIYQGDTWSTRTGEAVVHSVSANTYIDVYRIIGQFSNTSITGNTSNATANVTIESDSVHLDNAFEDIVDNNRIETESDLILDFNINNPFGES